MALTKKLLWEGSSAPTNGRDVVALLDSINRRLGYLLISAWVAVAAGMAWWVIRQAVVIAGW